MKEYTYFVLGMMVLSAALGMLFYAKRIRQSRFWFLGWISYILGIVGAFRLMMPVINTFPIRDDVAIPVMAGVMMVAIVVMFSYQMYRIRHPRRRGQIVP